MIFIPNMQIWGISICCQIDNDLLTCLSWPELHLCVNSSISVLHSGSLTKALVSLTEPTSPYTDFWFPSAYLPA